jgi:hypothetical protein
MSLTVAYPRQQVQSWVPAEETVSHSTILGLAPAGAGPRYCILWWAGMLVGSLLVLLPGVLLALVSASFRRRALPTKIIDPPLLVSELDDRERIARAPGDEIRLLPPPWYREEAP